MSAVDAGFLYAEDSDRHISLAVGALCVLDGPMPDYENLVHVIGERFMQIPRLRQTVRQLPFDLAAPTWVDDPGVDLSHHIRRAALPAPGDDEALFRFAAEAMETRLDRERPLWQCWVIEGLAQNRWAILIKVHHCIADGVATVHMLSALSDSGLSETYAAIGAQPFPRSADSPPSLSLNPLRWAQSAGGAALTIARTAVVTVTGALEIVDGIARIGRPSTLTGSLTTMRRYSAVQVPLSGVTTVCDSFGVTVNDVALAAITDSFRTALLRRGERLGRGSLRTLVPVSVRSHDAMATPDNRVSVMLACLPVDEPDRLEQLRVVHQRLRQAKSGGQRQAGIGAVAALQLAPFALTAWTLRALTRLPQRGIVTLATNVPGPRQRLQVMGCDVVHLYPIPPVAQRLRTAVAILSYGGQLTFGVITDFDSVPDVDDLAFGIKKAVAWLASAAHRTMSGGRVLRLVPRDKAQG